MTIYRHAGTGELSQTPVGDPAEWTALPATPNGLPDGWRWDQAAGAWEARGPRRWKALDFQLMLLTPEEVVAFDSVPPLLPEAPALRYAVTLAKQVEIVDLDNATTVALLQMGVAAGILTEARAARILAGLPPI